MWNYIVANFLQSKYLLTEKAVMEKLKYKQKRYNIHKTNNKTKSIIEREKDPSMKKV